MVGASRAGEIGRGETVERLFAVPAKAVGKRLMKSAGVQRIKAAGEMWGQPVFKAGQ